MFGLDMSAVDVFPADVTEEPEVIIEDETIDQLSDDERRTLSALNMTLREFVALKVRFDSAHGEITDFTDVRSSETAGSRGLPILRTTEKYEPAG